MTTQKQAKAALSVAAPEFDVNRIRVAIHGPGAMPADAVALRREVYTEEVGLLRDEDLVGANDTVSQHICLYYQGDQGEILIATMAVSKAEGCDFAQYTGLELSSLSKGFYLSRGVVAAAFRRHGLLALLIYLAGREARLCGRSMLYAYMTEGEPPARRIMRYSLIETLPPRSVTARDGSAYQVAAAWVDLAYGMHRAYTSLSPALRAFLASSQLLAKEVEQTTRLRLEQFFTGPWFERLYAGNLTKEQYIATLANMHQFVRWTTRLLGRLVAATADSELRSHYCEHLAGEVNHELMLESDLKHLGADVDYVVNHMVPIVEIQEYMSVQESTAAFHQDPVVFLAVPFSIEGLSGHLPKTFGPALQRCIAAWGINDPRKVTAFLSSHVHTDGGVDGHWEQTRLMIGRYVQTEKQVQQLLNVVQLVTNSLDRAYAVYAAQPQLSKTAADGERRERKTA